MLLVRPRMKLAINGALYGSIVDFGKAIEGPKIESFESKYYGSGVELLYIELALQNEKGTNRDFSTYRSEHAWAQFSIVMGSGIDSDEEVAAFRSIASRMYDGLEKGFKRRKIPDFDYVSFLKDLRAYVASKTETA
jgi:hypothetical protein